MRTSVRYQQPDPISLLVVLAALFIGFSLVATAAAFADTHFSQAGSAAGQVGIFTGGIATSAREGGDLYLADSENQRVDQFHADGTFVRAFGWGVNASSPLEELQVCTTATGCTKGTEGAAPGQLNWSAAIAVDNSCAEHSPPLTSSTTPTCEEFDSSYGDLYLVDQRNWRVEKYSANGEFISMFGGGVDQGPHHPGDLCTAAYLAEGDTCGAGQPGTGPAHFYQGATFYESWSSDAPNGSIAVGPDGTVYVGDYGRIQEFNPAGAFVGELSLADPDPSFVTAIALDSAGDLYERSATYGLNGNSELAFTHEVPGVREYEPRGTARALIRTFDAGPDEAGSEATHIALEPGGNVYLFDYNAGDPEFRAFKPDGTEYAVFASPQIPKLPENDTTILQPRGLAFDPATGKLYAPFRRHEDGTPTSPPVEETYLAAVEPPSTGAPQVSGIRTTDVSASTATLRGTVNPRGFKTEYYFQYVDQHDFESGGFTNPSTETVPVLPAKRELGLILRDDPVTNLASGLSSNTTYHFRLVAENEEGSAEEDSTFTTLPPASIRALTTQTVAPELVKIKAEVNPNAVPGNTSWTLRYGRISGQWEGEAQGQLPTGIEFEPLEATFSGLLPNTTYHYELLASNGLGNAESGDQSFTTEPSSVELRTAESCPNRLLREENSSLSLPDCRAYEQVSPANKNGYDTSLKPLLAPSGNAAQFRSDGIFAGAEMNSFAAEYVAHRTDAGWHTVAAIGNPAGPGYQPGFASDYSAELDRWVFQEQPGLSWRDGALHASTGALYMGEAGGGFVMASPTLTLQEGENETDFYPVRSQSADLSTLFIFTSYRLLASDPRPGATGSSFKDRVYVIHGAGGPNPTIRLEAEVPLGVPRTINSAAAGCGIDAAFGDFPNGSSADGNIFTYASPLEILPGGKCDSDLTQGPNKVAVFARIGNAPPIQLSTPPAGGCTAPAPCSNSKPADAELAGISPSGSRIWFTTAQPLIDSDTDSTSDLYMAKLEDGHVAELVQASAGEASAQHPDVGQGAGVQGVVRISGDGSHAYFVATGVLTDHPNANGDLPAAGADNLYVFDADSGEVAFIARLCSSTQSSGSQQDAACPAGANDSQIWDTGQPEKQAQPNPSGRDLLFTSAGRLTADDTDDAPDVFRFDERTDRLSRLSFGYRGNDGNGNDSAYPAGIQTGHEISRAEEDAEDGRRSISADGATAIFETEAPLSSHDTDRATDVYEWEEDGHGTCSEPGGCVSLVSDGVDPHGTHGGVIDSSGANVAFYSQHDEVPDDTDGVGDIYTARIDGGFPLPSSLPSCNSPETCHEKSPEALLTPNYTSAETHSGGNGPVEIRCSSGRHKVKKHGQVRCVPNKSHRHHHKKRHRHKNRRPRGKVVANHGDGGHR